MLKAVEGVYSAGKVELKETPAGVSDETPVVVTFLGPSDRGKADTAADLRDYGIDAVQAADLRGRLATFAEGWERPEMDVYDDYDRART